MWEKLKNLSGKAKAGIIGGVALLAAAGVGLGVWQPWNQPEEEPTDPPPVQQEVQEPEETPEKPLSLRVQGKEVPCVLYEGDGWSIYVPEEWSTEKLGENGGRFTAPDGTQLSVAFDNGGYTGDYVNLSQTGDGKQLQFYSGTGARRPVVEGRASQAAWEDYDRLFVSMARTLTVGTETPFADSYVIPNEPDWQEADGMTVLFLDKDGYIMDDPAQEAIESYMESWPEEAREIFTGQYRLNALEWASSYVSPDQDGYIDVFRADVQYRVRDGASPEGVSVVNGWASGTEDVYLALFHDGGAVSETRSVVSTLENGWIGFAGEVM